MDNKKKYKTEMSDLISRSFVNYRAEEKEDGGAVIAGTPIVFDEATDIGGMWQETIQKGAVSEDILKDVAFFYNHDLNTKPIARTRTGKLKLTVSEKGVEMEALVNRERHDVNDLYLAIKDGDIDGMSFMFRVEEEEWIDLDTDYPKRFIKKIGYIQEVSAVNYPAYSGTNINARALDSVEELRKTLDSAKEKRSLLDSKEAENSLELEKQKILTLLNF